MKKNILFFLLFLATTLPAQTEVFNSLLQTHVTKNGWVDYVSFQKDKTKLSTYISYLEKTTPDKTWSKNKEKAFWINAYNAYTIQLIIENYPLKSILKIKQKGKDAWNIPLATIGGKTYTLNAIEHEILRKKFDDPRIHVGINCASNSCPKLGNFAFTEENINVKLDNLMRTFVNDTSRNNIRKEKIKISKIFEWFQEDFTKNGSLIDYLNQYTSVKIKKNAKISFQAYDWRLNKR